MNKTFLLLISLFVILAGCENNKQVEVNEQLRIGMAQIFCLDGDRSGNFVRIENALREAVEKGAHIVCFPETSILGWVNPEAHQRAYPIPGKDSDRLSELAKKYNVYICAGLAEKNGDQLHDSVILIDKNGRIILKHRKINILTELMTPPYTPGNTVGTVDTEFGSIGLLICADTFFEEKVKELREYEPDLMLIPYGWAAPEEDWPEHSRNLEDIVRKTAITLECTVVGTDLVGEISNGPWTGQIYGGQSVAVDAEGMVLARAADRDRDVVVFDVPLSQ